MITSTLLAVLAALLPSGPPLQDPGHREPRPLEDLQRFDNEALLGSWGRDESYVGRIPKEPRPAPPPPIRPANYLIVDASGPVERAWQAFVCKHVLDRSSPVPVEDSSAPLGDAKWHRAKMPPKGELTGELRFAYATLHTDRSEVWMARLPGASALFVNGEGFIGDPERRGFLGVPVELRAGDNQVFVAGIKGGFELEFWKPQTRMVIGTWDISHEHLERGWESHILADLVVPVFNASIEPARDLHHHNGHLQCDDGNVVPQLSDWHDGGTVGPLGLITKGSNLIGTREGDAGPDCTKFLLPLCSYNQGDPDADRRVLQLALGDVRAREGVPPAWSEARIDSSSFLVYGTNGSEEDRATSLALARYHQQRLWYWSNICPTLLPDNQVTPRDGGNEESHGFAFVIGRAPVNAAVGNSWVPVQKPPDHDSTIEVTAPARSHPQGVPPSLGVVYAPDALTMRMLYAVDPFSDLRPDDKSAGFSVDSKTGTNFVRRW